MWQKAIFCHSELSEESLGFVKTKMPEILRNAQNENFGYSATAGASGISVGFFNQWEYHGNFVLTKSEVVKMQNLLQALNNLINVALLIATPILVIALIIAGLNMASADGGRHEKAKRQLIGITIAVIVIFGAKFLVPALINLVPGASSASPF